MNKLNFLILALLLSSCATLKPASDAQHKRDYRTIYYDNAIQRELAKVIAALDPQEANVISYTYNSKVLLLGESKSEILKNNLIRRAENIERVQEVFDQININKNFSPYSLKEKLADSKLSNTLKQKLVWDKEIDTSRFDLVAFKSKIFLMGTVNAKLEQKVIKQISNTEGVSEIHVFFEYY